MTFLIEFLWVRGEGQMDKMQRIAEDMLDLTRSLKSDSKTFKCPNCGTPVLKQTGYCVKCKKKVKEAAQKIASDQDDPWFTIDHVRSMCAACADKMERNGFSKIRKSAFLEAVGLKRFADMTWDECIADAKKTGKKSPEAFCGWLKNYGPHGETKKGPSGKVPKGYHPQMAKEVLGTIWWECTLKGGDRGGVAFFSHPITFVGQTAGQIGQIMKRYGGEIDKVLKSLPKGIRIHQKDEIRMSSGKPCVLVMEVYLKWSSGEKAQELVAYLESRTNIDVFNDWIDL